MGARLAEPARRERLPEHFGELAWAADVALFGLVARSPLAERRPLGDGFAFVTGLTDNTRNGVVCSHLPAAQADARIAEVLGWLRQRGAPGQWLVARETEPPDLRERLVRAGCQPERTAVQMAALLADLDLSPRPAPEGLGIVSLTDAAELDGADAARLLVSLGTGEAVPVRHYAARLGGRTVGVASVLIHEATLAGLELEVAPSDRRRGIGRALVLHALREGRAAGCSVATIAPIPATVPLYEALGFVLERYPPDRALYTPVELAERRRIVGVSVCGYAATDGSVSAAYRTALGPAVGG